MPFQINKKVVFVVKIIFTTLFFSYFFTQINAKQQLFKSIADVDFHITNTNVIFLCLIIFLLSCVNWFIETLKWYLCLSLLSINVSLKNTFKAVLAGLATSLLLPNRSGEFVGRIYQLIDKPRKSNQIYLSMYSSLAQQLCTWVFAIIGLIAYSTKISFVESNALYLPFVYILGGVFFFTYFFIDPIFNYISRFWKIITNFYLYIKTSTKIRLLLLSAFRYLVFSFQYFLALYILGISSPNYTLVFALISINFLLSSYMPTFLLTEIGIRGAVSIILFQTLSDDMGAIFLASLFIWIVNIVIPAFLGWVFIIRNRKEIE